MVLRFDFLKQTTLADVIRRNTGITNLQADVFFVGGGGVSRRAPLADPVAPLSCNRPSWRIRAAGR
jgi:hypothetical protein